MLVLDDNIVGTLSSTLLPNRSETADRPYIRSMAIHNGALLRNREVNSSVEILTKHSLTNGVFHHVRFTRTIEPEIAAPPDFLILLDLFRAELTVHMLRSFSEYLNSDSPVHSALKFTNDAK